MVNNVMNSAALRVRKMFSYSIGKQILIAMIIGILLGVVFRYVGQYISFINPSDFKILGDIFLDLIKMVMTLFVFFSISSAVLSIDDMSQLGRKASRGVVIFFVTTSVACIIGMLIAMYFGPGKGVTVPITSSVSNALISKKTMTVSGMILDIIPDNIFKSFYNGHIMQIMFFAIIFSIAIAVMKAKTSRCQFVIRFINDMSDVMYGIMIIIMKFAPFGVFGLMVWLMGTQDLSILYSLIKLFLVCVLGVLLLIVMYVIMLLLIGRTNPLPFLKKMIPVQLFGLATSSSAVTLPMNLRNAKENLGISDTSANLLMPIGANLNMNGAGCILAIFTVFVAQIYDIHISFSDMVTIFMLAMLGSLATPPIPGGGIIALSAILSTINYPIEAITLILSIDKLIAPLRVFGNVTGDAFAPLLIDALDGSLDHEKYNSK